MSDGARCHYCRKVPCVCAPAPKQETPLYCDGCDGTGLMDGWNRRDGSSCPKCKGTGLLPKQETPPSPLFEQGPKIPCPRCAGHGAIPENGSCRTCDLCEGQQKVPTSLAAKAMREASAQFSDAERLDWLHTSVTLNGEFEAVKLWDKAGLQIVAANVGAKGSHPTVREAIDAAMRSAGLVPAATPQDALKEAKANNVTLREFSGRPQRELSEARTERDALRDALKAAQYSLEHYDYHKTLQRIAAALSAAPERKEGDSHANL